MDPWGGRPGRLGAGVAAGAATLAALAFLCLGLPPEQSLRVVLEKGPPPSVLALEAEAKKDVENDATNAGLAALASDKSSLTASLTGGLKRDLWNMKRGDDALLKHIESASGRAGRGAKGSRGRTGGGDGGGGAENVNKDVAKELQRAKMFVDGQAKGEGQAKQDNAVAMTAVIAAVTRDKARENALMALVRAKLARMKHTLLHEQALAHKQGLGGSAAGKDTAAEDDKKLATAKELLLKAKALKAQSESMEKKAFEDNFSKSASLEAAMQKQKAILNHLKKEEDIAHRKEKAKADLQMAKRLSTKSIRELKLAGIEIKKSEAFMKLGEKKAGKKLQQESQKLTEKAVHTMLRSRRVSHKATDDLNAARSVNAELPGLRVKGKQAQLVLNVLRAQQKAAKVRLRSNLAYLKATALSHKMSDQASKDIKLAGDLMKEGEEEAARRRAGLRQGTLKEVAEIRHRLWELRAKLSRQEKFVKSDDAILDALSQQK